MHSIISSVDYAYKYGRLRQVNARCLIVSVRYLFVYVELLHPFINCVFIRLQMDYSFLKKENMSIVMWLQEIV